MIAGQARVRVSCARRSGRFCARRSATWPAHLRWAVAHGSLRAAGGGSQIGPVASLMRFDAQYYSRIVENGYSYSPMHGSNVAFFPAYPLVARVLRGRLGIPSSTALLIVANGCLAGAMFVFARYLGIRRQPKGDANCRGDAGSPSPPATFLSAPQSDAQRARSSAHALWALALLPTTFFFRMPYSEALFLFVALVALYAIERQWALPWTVAVVGLATAVRPVGVALLLPFGWFVIKRCHSAAGCPRSERERWRPSRRWLAIWASLWAAGGCWPT